jgi:hypothetical protein
MLELVHARDEIQGQARKELKAKFEQFDIQCVDVLIGRPESKDGDDKIEGLLEQLRVRQLSLEQIETYGKQEAAQGKQRTLNEAMAQSAMQKDLTASKIAIEIASNNAEADLARAKKQAEQTVVTAKADSEKLSLFGQGEGSKIQQIGTSEADILHKKIESFGDSRLYALSLVAEALSNSKQPLVPSTLLGGGGAAGGDNMFGMLISLLVAEKAGTHLGIDGRAKSAEPKPEVLVEEVK